MLAGVLIRSSMFIQPLDISTWKEVRDRLDDAQKKSNITSGRVISPLLNGRRHDEHIFDHLSFERWFGEAKSHYRTGALILLWEIQENSVNK
jgi:hypothetical protein